MSKSIHLSQQMKEQIEGALLHHRFEKDISAAEAERARLADLVYCDLYKASMRARMEELPEGWLPMADYIAAHFGDDRDGYEHLKFSGNLHFNKCDLGLPAARELKEVRRRLASKHTNSCVKVYAEGHKLTILSREHKATTSTLREQIREARLQVRALLKSVSTTKQLREAWPEAAPFVASIDPAPPPKVPAPRTNDLNAILNLPADGVAA